jgi:hypothetical protein
MPDPVPAVLLARLAIGRHEQGQHLGGHLLVDALHRCVLGGRDFGTRAVVVDAIDERAAQFYRHFDFHDLDQGRLWRRLADIATALGTRESIHLCNIAEFTLFFMSGSPTTRSPAGASHLGASWDRPAN